MGRAAARKKWLLLLILCLLLLAYLYYRGRLDTEAPAETAQPATYAPLGAAGAGDALLVDLRNDATEEQRAALERKYGLELRPNSRFSLPERLYRTVAGRLDGRRSGLQRLLERLRREPAVERAELDAIYGIPPLEAEATRWRARDEAPGASFPNDPKYRYQWHMRQIGMPEAWPRAQGEGVIVAVIDTGVGYADRAPKFKRVPDLAQTEFVPGYDFINRHEHPLDDHGHGTHVAGTIAQSTHNGVGVTGIAYRAKIMPLKVLSARGFGSVADIAEAIRFATDHGAKVINMSLGGGRSSTILAAAVKYAVSRGVTVVCAAGNDGRGKVSFPAAYPGAIAVAATQFDESTTFYSNWGKEIDVAAPGGNTRVDQNGDGMPDGVLQNTIRIGNPLENDYLMFMGTSMASPHVAGVAALVIGEGVSEPGAVLKLLQSTARHPQNKRRDDRYGAGIVSASRALEKTATAWGGYRLGLAALLGLLLLGRLRERRLLGLRPGVGAALGALLGAAGLFFLPSLGLAPTGAWAPLLLQGFPSWDLALLGPAGHANPLFFSALMPIALAAVLYRVPRARGFIFGFAVGVAAHLIFHVLFRSADVAWLPGALLDHAWLLLNAAACAAVASVVARE